MYLCDICLCALSADPHFKMGDPEDQAASDSPAGGEVIRETEDSGSFLSLQSDGDRVCGMVPDPLPAAKQGKSV